MATNPKPRVITISRFQIGLNVLLQLLIVAGIVVMVNYLSFRHFKRWDFSRDQKFSLSSQTRNLLANLKKPVRAVIFFSSATEVTPDVTALLREYEFASNKNFATEVVDPFRSFTRASELQAKYKFGANENILILDYDGRSKFVNAADMAEFEQPDQMAMMAGQTQPKLKAFKGEQAITSALLELTEGKPNKIYLITGHGEPELGAQELKVFEESLKRQNIQATGLNLLSGNSVPADARAVVLCGPKYDLSELEMKLLSDFWDAKGRLLVLLNPFTKTQRLADWLGEKGITQKDDRVIKNKMVLEVDPTTGSPKLKAGTERQALAKILESGISITRDLAAVSPRLHGPTCSLQLDRTKETTAKVRIIPFLESGEGYWGETDNAGGDERPAFFDPKKDHAPPLTIGAAVEQGGVDDSRVKVDTSRLVVIGNSELITNNGYRTSEGVTLDLAVNALNWLLDRDEQVGIAPREKKSIALSLDERQLGQIALAVMVILPGIAALIGLLSYWRRRS